METATVYLPLEILEMATVYLPLEILEMATVYLALEILEMAAPVLPTAAMVGVYLPMEILEIGNRNSELNSGVSNGQSSLRPIGQSSLRPIEMGDFLAFHLNPHYFNLLSFSVKFRLPSISAFLRLSYVYIVLSRLST